MGLRPSRRVAPLVFLSLLAACSDVAATEESESELNGDEVSSTSTIDEDEEVAFDVPSAGVRRFDVEGLPAGARFDGQTGRFTFRPDFTQSGRYSIVVTAHHGEGTADARARIDVIVRDSIAPPPPSIVSESAGDGFTRLVVEQKTDAFLDSPGRAGRTFQTIVVVPSAATKSEPMPVVVGLHGFAAGPNPNAASTATFRIEPHDPDNTYWWGYGDWLPAEGPPPPGGEVKPYTMRRVLHLLDWLLRSRPEADADRVFATGASMGGAGALLLGFMHARHFAGIEASIAQPIARNHRPSRIGQLSGWWGTPEANVRDVWNMLDVTRILRDSSEARDQFVFTKHGKDDSTIHFGATVMPSPLTGKSFYEAIEEGRIGHLTVWDEGAHGPPDPVLGDGWWDNRWSRITDPKSFLTRRAPFPAFTRSSANEVASDPSGMGNDERPFDRETGFAGKLDVAGDTGWSGAIAGAFNRFLRWDTNAIVETHDKLALPLRVVASSGDAAPKAGYPTKGDRYDGPLPIVADVSPRRLSSFRLKPGESVHFRFGEASGAVVADGDGTVTVPSLPITTTPTVLELERSPL